MKNINIFIGVNFHRAIKCENDFNAETVISYLEKRI